MRAERPPQFPTFFLKRESEQSARRSITMSPYISGRPCPYPLEEDSMFMDASEQRAYSEVSRYTGSIEEYGIMRAGIEEKYLPTGETCGGGGIGDGEIGVVVGKGLDSEEQDLIQEGCIGERRYGFYCPTLPEDIRHNFSIKSAEIREYMDIHTNIHWEDMGTDKGMHLWAVKDPDCLVFRTEIIIDRPLEEVVTAMRDLAIWPLYDQNYKKCEVVEEYNECAKLLRYVIKGHWPVAERDFILRNFGFYENENTYRIYAYDAYNYTHPVERGVVRASLPMMGCILTRESENKTKFVNFSKTDPKIKGLPTWVLRTRTKDAAMIALHFKQYIESTQSPSAH